VILNFLRKLTLMTAFLALAAAPALMVPRGALAQESQAKLIEYSAATDLASLARDGKTVVFFFATWCPNCILTLTELSQKWAEVDPDVTVVIADYDKETELKAKYGVTYQDTFVLLDKDANSAKLWNAGGVAGLNENVRAQ
jgi:thiol-disulfide isomerase/thioredoxin